MASGQFMHNGNNLGGPQRKVSLNVNSMHLHSNSRDREKELELDSQNNVPVGDSQFMSSYLGAN